VEKLEMSNTAKNKKVDHAQLSLYISKYLMDRLENMSIITKREKADLVREALTIYVGSFERDQKNQS
jgi:predicted DNA-binding protein